MAPARSPALREPAGARRKETMTTPITRRTFGRAVGLGAAASVLPGSAWAGVFQTKTPQTAVPRWRGFNLLDLFQALAKDDARGHSTDEVFRWMRDWGFNFVRVPLDYWFWIDSDCRQTKTIRKEDVLKIRESALERVDAIVENGRKYGLHVNLNMHRAPGYCINGAEREPFVLWSDRDAQTAFALHWEMLAMRYRGVSPFDLSFNLVNEAPSPKEGYMSRADYARVMQMGIDAIRAITPQRLILVDGLDVGNTVVTELIPAGVGQSVHSYWPAELTHYRAAWVDHKMDFPEPAWPILNADGTVKTGRAQLEEHFKPWGELAAKNVPVHCGEMGCFNRTPHAVALKWMGDVLEILEGYGIGWALWEFRGSFGILDSGRADVAYEDWHGLKLDRQMLSLLQAH
jgi:aryl-phospho-beta-D-glucosidase BglC (GH1 family)